MTGFLDVDLEDPKMDTINLSAEKQPVESCVVESGKCPALPSSKFKSYKVQLLYLSLKNKNRYSD